MTFRFNPKIYLLTGLLFWSLFSFFHLILFFQEEELNNSIYRAIYLIFLGSFLFSFYRYYDLVFPKVSRKEIFNNFFRILIFGIKSIFPIALIYLLYFFKVGGDKVLFSFFSILIHELVLGISLLFLIINFVFFKRLILFEANSVMKAIFMAFQYGAIIIFVFDIVYNFYPSDIFQFLLAGLFMIGGILLFNQKWIAYMYFDQKWKTILISLFLISSNILIYQFFILNQEFFTGLFDIKSLLFLILLMGFNFTYLSISVLINIFNLPTSPVFDDLENEKFIALKVQENLIPNILPNSKKLKITSSYMPHFALGGDYYDYISLNKDKFLICIADVSGKGIPAALLMSNVQASLRTMARQTENLKKIVEELNFQINLRGLSERFISIFLCKYDFNLKELEYVNCGHPHPILFYNNKIEKLDKGSTVLGMFNDLPKFKVSTVTKLTEFNLFCYTDGLIETQNDFGDFYGSERVLKLFSNNRKKPKKFIKNILNDLNEFKGNNLIDDDITLLMTSVNNE